MSNPRVKKKMNPKKTETKSSPNLFTSTKNLLGWHSWHPLSKTIVKLFPVLFILLAIPLTVNVLQKQQNITQKAASPDQLEAEGGVLGGDAVVVSDSNASGGQSVRFSLANPTQGVSPTPTSPSLTASVSTNKTSYNAGENIAITVNGGNSNVQEWIALYVASNPDSAYSFEGNWKYLNGLQTPPASPLSYPVSLSFVAPTTAGTYNIRYFAFDEYSNRLAISQNFTVTSSTLKSVTVSSIVALKTALADNTIDEIVVVNGTYHVSTAGSRQADSLWIGSAYAGRTRPILVRAQTIGGVIFDGGGTTWFGGITFVEGAHDQTWQGFKWANGTPGGINSSGQDSGTGVINIGGYQNALPAHHITLQDCEVSALTDYVTATGGTTTHGHAVYIAQAYGEGPHHFTFNRLKFNSTSRSGSTATPTFNGALHWYHDYLDTDAHWPNHFNAHDFTVTNSQIIGGKWAVIIWARTLQNLLIDGLTVTNAQQYGFRYEGGGGITLRNITTTGSGWKGFAPTSYEPGGPYSYPTIPEYTETGVGPANIIFTNTSFN